MKSRGMSSIIATVLIVLITFSAAAILMQFIVPFVKDSLDKSTECVKTQDYFKFSDGSGSYNCFAGNNFLMTVGAANDNDSSTKVKGFAIVFLNVDSEKVMIPGDSNVHLMDYGKPVVLLGPGEIRTYNISLSGPHGVAEIYPVLMNDRICKKSDSIKLEACG